MDDIERLWAIEQIKQLKARYFRLMDKKRWDEFAEVVAKNAVFGKDDAIVHGRDAIVENVSGTAGTAKTVHHGHMPEIEIIDDTNARGVWAMYDYYLERPDEGAAACGFEGAGHYEETYLFEDGAWRIQTCILRRLKITPIGAGLPAFYRR